MAGRRALQSVNWAALAERVGEKEKNSLAALKAKYDLYFRHVQENPETPPKLDWAHYKSRIGVPGLVDKFQKEYESLKIDFPQDKYTSQVEAWEKQTEAYIKDIVTKSNEKIAQYESEIRKLEGLLKYGQMTMEDFAEAHPEMALNPLNRPTIFPHTSEVQPNENDDKEHAAHH